MKVIIEVRIPFSHDRSGFFSDVPSKGLLLFEESFFNGILWLSRLSFQLRISCMRQISTRLAPGQRLVACSL